MSIISHHTIIRKFKETGNSRNVQGYLFPINDNSPIIRALVFRFLDMIEHPTLTIDKAFPTLRGDKLANTLLGKYP